MTNNNLPSPSSGYDIDIGSIARHSSEQQGQIDRDILLTTIASIFSKFQKADLDDYNLWYAIAGEEGSPVMYVGKYEAYEGIANSGLEPRNALVITLVNNDYMASLSPNDTPEDSGSPTQVLYLIAPVSEEDLLNYPELPPREYSEFFVLSVIRSPDGDEKLDFICVSKKTIAAYNPTGAILQEIDLIVDYPGLVSKLGGTARQSTIVGEILETMQTMTVIPHSELPESLMIFNYTGEYFGKSELDQ